MDYVVHLADIKPFDVQGVVTIEVRDECYFLYNENGEILLTAPREKVKGIASKVLTE